MLTIANTCFESRLFLGTGKFSSQATMKAAIDASKTEMVTLAIRRVNLNETTNSLTSLASSGVRLLPNTSGARNAEEAVYAAHVAREMLDTQWLKLEIHPDTRHLMPDPIETLKAAEELVKQGFIVLPYITADPVLAKHLENCGCAAVMPLASPIGSNRGLQSRDFLELIIEQANIPVVIDAGLGKPSDAMLAMEMGADAVLVNTAIATASNPTSCARTFAQATTCGRESFKAQADMKAFIAIPTSPMTEFEV